MKRLTYRYKNWLTHRGRYEAKRRGKIKARLSRMRVNQLMTSLYEVIKEIARHLQYRESFYVIWAYCQFLQVRNFRIPNDIEVAPQFLAAKPHQAILSEWSLEQIAREVIQYSVESPPDLRSLRVWNTLARIANALRDLEGEIYKRFVNKRLIHLELMRVAHRQFIWQQYRLKWVLIIRYFKLFNTGPINSFSQKATGLTIEQIFLIGMSLLGHFFDNPFIEYPIKVEIPGLDQHDVEHFLRFASRSLSELRNKLGGEHALDEGFGYRYSSFREFPLIKISQEGKSEIVCPIPTLLFWRITTGLYYALKNEKGFTSAFGNSFQEYAGAVLSRRISNERMRVHKEAEYWVGKRRKDTVDWIIEEGEESALLIECKIKRLTLASKVGLSDLTALEHDLGKLAGAVVQVYRTINDYRNGQYPNLTFNADRRIYPAIVVLEDWYFFGLDMPVRLDAAIRTGMAKAGLPAEWLETMPYSIMIIDELESAAGVINTVGVHAFISGKVLDPALRYWAYGAYCNEKYKEQVADLPALFEDEYEAMFAGLENADQKARPED